MLRTRCSTVDDTRYELHRLDHSARFCPVVGDVVGFASATDAMLHLFEQMPSEALLWEWVPIWEDYRRTEEGHRAGV